MQWSWQTRGKSDGKGDNARLRVEVGKFKGWYLAAEAEPDDAANVIAGPNLAARKLKLVRAPSEALKFHIYVVSK